MLSSCPVDQSTPFVVRPRAAAWCANAFASTQAHRSHLEQTKLLLANQNVFSLIADPLAVCAPHRAEAPPSRDENTRHAAHLARWAMMSAVCRARCVALSRRRATSRWRTRRTL